MRMNGTEEFMSDIYDIILGNDIYVEDQKRGTSYYINHGQWLTNVVHQETQNNTMTIEMKNGDSYTLTLTKNGSREGF